MKRSALVPDVPTVAEASLTDYQSTGWRGLLDPAGIPAPIQARLTQEVKAIANEVKSYFLANAMEIDYRDPQ